MFVSCNNLHKEYNGSSCRCLKWKYICNNVLCHRKSSSLTMSRVHTFLSSRCWPVLIRQSRRHIDHHILSSIQRRMLLVFATRVVLRVFQRAAFIPTTTSSLARYRWRKIQSHYTWKDFLTYLKIQTFSLWYINFEIICVKYIH